MNLRTALSVLLLVLALGSAGALAVFGLRSEAGETASYPVLVVGSSGETLLNETVQVEEGTVLRALQLAAEARSIELELTSYAGMGTYVRAIAGQRAEGATGWIYEVHRDGEWLSGDRSAELFALQKGDATRWTWTAG